jgi:L-amino acid N-acyltransferase YncA
MASLRRYRRRARMVIRDATSEDWPAIWRFLREIAAAGETFTLDRDIGEPEARAMWMLEPPARTVVAVGSDGTVLGSAKMNPNQRGPGAHIASASYMVDPEHAGRGVGRALGEETLDWARREGYRAMQFNAVVETNTRAVALWRSLGFEVLGTLPEGFHHPTEGYVGLHILHRRL